MWLGNSMKGKMHTDTRECFDQTLYKEHKDRILIKTTEITES